MKMKPEIEVVYEVWPNDGDAWHVDIGPDRDGLRCVEIRIRDEAGKITQRMMFTPDFAKLVGEAIVLSANDILNKKPIVS